MKKNILQKTPPPFKNKEDYIGDTNENAHEPNDSPSKTDVCVRNLGKGKWNEEDE